MMTWPTEQSVSWYTKQLDRFKGWVVIGTTTGDDGYYALLLKDPKTDELGAIWLYSDDEGNMPGSFEIVRGGKGG